MLLWSWVRHKATQTTLTPGAAEAHQPVAALLLLLLPPLASHAGPAEALGTSAVSALPAVAEDRLNVGEGAEVEDEMENDKVVAIEVAMLAAVLLMPVGTGHQAQSRARIHHRVLLPASHPCPHRG